MKSLKLLLGVMALGLAGCLTAACSSNDDDDLGDKTIKTAEMSFSLSFSEDALKYTDITVTYQSANGGTNVQHMDTTVWTMTEVADALPCNATIKMTAVAKRDSMPYITTTKNLTVTEAWSIKTSNDGILGGKDNGNTRVEPSNFENYVNNNFSTNRTFTIDASGKISRESVKN